MPGGEVNENDAVVVDPDSIAEATDPLGIGAVRPNRHSRCCRQRVHQRVGSRGRVAEGSHTVTHWHIDYFGGHDSTSLVGVVAAPRANVECRLATELRDRASASQTVGAGSGAGAGAGSGAGASPHGSGGRPLDGCGASDCDCPTHFVGGAGPKELHSWAAEAFQRVQR